MSSLDLLDEMTTLKLRKPQPEPSARVPRCECRPVEASAPATPGYSRNLLIFATFLLAAGLGVYFAQRLVLRASEPQKIRIEGTSMSPTLHDGQRCSMDSNAVGTRQPSRGDLIIFRRPGYKSLAIKRVLGLPNETIEIKEGGVFVNGNRMQEAYLPAGTETTVRAGSSALVILGPDRYFVLGDNRDGSEDSRHFGPITWDTVVGYLNP